MNLGAEAQQQLDSHDARLAGPGAWHAHRQGCYHIIHMLMFEKWAKFENATAQAMQGQT